MLENRRKDGKGPDGYLSKEQIKDVLEVVAKHPKIVKELVADYTSLLDDYKRNGAPDEATLENVKNILTVLNPIGGKSELAQAGLKKAKATQQAVKRGGKVKVSKRSKVPYLQYDEKYNIKSKKPEEIEGAQAALTFNPATRALSLFIAASPEGLSMKGRNFQNLDLAKSIVRRLPDPEKNLPKIQSSKVPQLVKRMSSGVEKTKSPRPIMRPDVVLLKTFK